MNVFNTLSGANQYKDHLGKFSFQYKVNLRRSLRRKNTRNTFAGLLNLDSDFVVDENYSGKVSIGQRGPNHIVRLSPDFITGPVIKDEEINLEKIVEVEHWYSKGRLLHRKYLYSVLQKVEHYYRQNCPTLVDIRLPKDGVINVCGDIHGQYYDMMKIFKLRGTWKFISRESSNEL